MHKNRLFWGCIFVVFLCFCSLSAAAQVLIDREYVIGIGDQMDIRIWGIPELSGTVAVRSDGKITMPRLGDVQAAGLKISRLKNFLEGKEEGKETIGKYVKDPSITITLTRSANNIRITFGGVISQVLEVPRQTMVMQVLKQLIPQLPVSPPPKLAEIKIIGSDGEEFLINWPELQSGQDPQLNIRLEWGDTIYIPSEVLPTPTPVPETRPSLPPAVNYTEEEIQALLENYPDKRDAVLSAAVQLEDGSYSFDREKMTDEQLKAIGEEVLDILFKISSAPPRDFTDITLVGINVNLAVDNAVEAYLAIPNPQPDQLPFIQRFREGDLIEKGETEEKNSYLEEIQDNNRQVILRKGNQFQMLPLLSPFSHVKLSGILILGDTRKAFFSELSKMESKKPVRRSFQEGEEIEKDILLAKISDRWVLLEKGQDIQLVFLRDSLNRIPPQPEPAPPAGQIEPFFEMEAPQTAPGMSLPTEALKRALPEPVRALDTFSKMFFATPIF